MSFLSAEEINKADHKINQVTIIGYGGQGQNQALILRDKNVKVIIALREGSSSKDKAIKDGFEVMEIASACKKSDFIIIATSDESHAEIFTKYINPWAMKGAKITFLHGYSYVYGNIDFRKDLILLLCAPKSSGLVLRKLFLQGKGVFGVIASEKEEHIDIAISYIKLLGCDKAGIIKSSFEEETIADLFSEQAVLCGGISKLITKSFEILVENGISPEIAYIECLHEVNLISDLYYNFGISGSNEKISNTAEYGKLHSFAYFKSIEADMEAIFNDIKNGKFAKKYAESEKNNKKELYEQRELEKEHFLEKIGQKMRQKFFDQ